MDNNSNDSKSGGILGGKLNILGFNLDLGELLDSPENLRENLGGLREKLKAMGGKEVLSDDEWQQGKTSISGHIRTGGILGNREFLIGTTGHGYRDEKIKKHAHRDIPEVVEPPVDVFDDDGRITIIADVPGITIDDLLLKLHGKNISLTTKPSARRNYRKEIELEANVDGESLKMSCNNGVLEIQINKKD